MRILAICYEFPPLGGGGGRVVSGLTRELARHGHAIDLVTMGFRGLPSREEWEGIRIHRVPCVRRSPTVCHTHEMLTYLVAALPVALRLARRNRYDVNHTHFILPDGLLALALKRLIGLPYVVTAHGSDVPGYNPDRFQLQHRLVGPVWQSVVRNAEEIICPSRSLQDLLLQRHEKAPVVLIPNGMTPSEVKPMEPREPRILVVSRLFERKGVQHLLHALEGVDLGLEVHVAGDGPYRPDLEALAARLRLPIRFHGWLENESPELQELYASSRIFVLPSVAENFPVVLLEAMSAGNAIVTTEGTGCAEVVGDAALLVPPGDPVALREALRRLAADPDLCAALGRRAQERVASRFSWSAVAERYAEAYRRHALPPSS
jgi:glycosyltransferase involved in cell wall biosynthesis